MNWIGAGLTFVIALICLVGVSAAETPNLLGNWSGHISGHSEELGFAEFDEGAIGMNITEQKDRVFTGEMVMALKNGSYRYEPFSGVIGDDGKEIYMAEHREGFILGKILDVDEIELIYLEIGDSAMVSIDHLFRKK